MPGTETPSTPGTEVPGPTQNPGPDQNPGTEVPGPGTENPGTEMPGPMTAVGEVPCDVNEVVKSNCHTCHGATPIGGAVPLVTHEDWHKMSMSPKYDTTKKVYEIAQIRINDGTMPQGPWKDESGKSMLDEWLLGGAVAATEETAVCTQTETPPVTETPGEGGDQCTQPGAYDPLVAEGSETCWEFKVHGPGSMDSKFTVAPGESYHEWYYDVPWPEDHVMTRFGAKFDNEPVLHHNLVFARPNSTRRHGDLDQNVTGTTLGDAAELISGWAVGGCRTEYPEHVGVELTARGKIMIQWHMYNNTGSPQQDGSIVQICTVPGSERPNHASLTFLGTELLGAGPLGMPPGRQEAVGSCTNNSGGDITIVGWTPHMHEIGSNMKTELRRADGMVETVFDEPFQFDYQAYYKQYPELTVKPGETLITTCTFENNTGANVAFGQSTKAEMCYQFTLAYPAGALNNGVISLIGATNTCW